MFSSGGAFGGGGGGFGQPSQNKPTGFGSTGGFGSTSTPTAGSTASGGFGSGSGIGGFGSNSTTTAANTGFGGGVGGGGFGASSVASGGASTGFGQQQGTSSLFGGGGGGFGSSSALNTGGFGMGATGMGATGTARAAFEPLIEHSATGKKENYRHLCFMNAYKAFSPEELRLEDYEAGRKRSDAPAGTATGGFGQTSGFGQQPANASGGFSGGFGQSAPSAFGQPAAASSSAGLMAGGGFGMSKPVTSTAAPGATGGGSSGFGGGFSGGSGIGGFGQSSTASGGMFGASSSKPSAFGQPAAASGAFGGGGGFGGTPSTGTTSAFGSSGIAAGSGTGGFGGSLAGGGGFGASAASNPTTAATGGMFGQSAGGFGAKPAFGAGSGGFGAGSGGFGQQQQQQPSAIGGGFGSQAGSTSTIGGFGQQQQQQQQQQQAAPSAFGQSGGLGGFGQTTATTGSLFGQQQQQPATTGTGMGLFGQTANAVSAGGGLFGAKPAAAPATGGGLFGQQQQQQQPAAVGGGGLFGQQQPAASGGGLFGSANTTTAASTGGGLFGAKPAGSTTLGGGGGLFGSTNTTAAASTGGGGGLFGFNAAAPTAGGGGLFGSSAAPTNAASTATGGGGLFGGLGAGPAAAGPTAGGGLFGAGSSGSGGGLFGSAGTAGAASGGFGFGGGGGFGQQTAAGQAPQQQPQQPQLLAAQIDKQPYGANALFDPARLAAGAGAKYALGGAGGSSSHLTATPLRSLAAAANQQQLGADAERDQMLKKRGLSLHSLVSSSVASPYAGSSHSSRVARSRGFAATKKPAAAAVASNTTGDGGIRRGLFGPDGFLSPEAQLPHSNVKRLVITRKPSFGSVAATTEDDSPARTRATAVATASAAPATAAAAAVGGGVSAMLQLGSPPLMKNPWAESPRKAPTPAATAMAGRTPAPRRLAGKSHDEVEYDEEEVFEAPPPLHGDYEEVEEEEEEDEDDVADSEGGEYWMRPSLAELRAMSTHQLRAVKNFTVGRTGVGQVSFCRPVDLTGVGSLAAIAGGVVLFDDRVCTVYPDESNKPARGLGLNVPANISLHDCWPVERATGARITRMDDPRVRKHIRRLRRIDETEFIDFVNGTWVFRVEHFSRYGLDDNNASSDDDEEYEVVAANMPSQGFGNATAQPTAPASPAAQLEQSQLDAGSCAVASSPAFPTSATESLDGDSDRDFEEDDLADFDTVPTQQQQQQQQQQHLLLLDPRRAESLRRGPVMRASLFASAPEPAPAPAPVPSATLQKQQFGRIQTQSPAISFALPKSKPRSKHKMTRAAIRDSASHATMAAPSVVVEALDLPPPSKFLRVNEARIARELLNAPQPYTKSLTHGRSGLGADAGLMMARSFRVAFGPQGQLVYLQGAAASAESFSKRGRGASAVVVIDSIARHLHASGGAAGGEQQFDLDRIRLRHLDTVRTQWRHARVEPAAVPASNVDVSDTGIAATAAIPRVMFDHATTSIASVLATWQTLTADYADSVISERQILELAAVLFDDDLAVSPDLLDLDQQAGQRVRMVRRRQALTRWLMDSVHDSVQRDLLRAGTSRSPAAAAVFALLSGHRIEAACLAATSHRDYRLAMLVAQSGGGAVGGGGNDEGVQALVRAQLAQMISDDSVTPDYRRVYELVAGRVPYASAAAVDWKRAFALGLWYAQSPADRIGDAVTLYERAVVGEANANAAAAPPPLPSWLFDTATFSMQVASSADDALTREMTLSQLENNGLCRRRAISLHRRGVWDPTFQLLKLFSDPAYPLERALQPESFSPARGDSRLAALLAWLLATVRRSRGFEDYHHSCGLLLSGSLAYDRLLSGWALQLEAVGLWHWAAFVMLQMSSPSHSAPAIRALLDRSMPTSLPTAALPFDRQLESLLLQCATDNGNSLPSSSSSSSSSLPPCELVEEQIRFVLDDLHLPRQWLYDALATRSRYDRDWADVRCGLVPPSTTFARSFFDQQQQLSSSMEVDSAGTLDATLRQVAWLLSARQFSAAHAVVLQRIAPDSILQGDYELLARLLSFMDPNVTSTAAGSSGVPRDDWMAGGHIYQAFLAAIDSRDGLPAVLQRIAYLQTTQDTPVELVNKVQHIYQTMRQLLADLPSLAARVVDRPGLLGFYDGFATEACWYSSEESRLLRVKYSVAVSDMASIISGYVQQLECHAPPPALLNSAQPLQSSPPSNTARLPLAQDVRILRTLQMARSCFDSLVASELEV